jgi:hypothetical protein
VLYAQRALTTASLYLRLHPSLLKSTNSCPPQKIRHFPASVCQKQEAEPSPCRMEILLVYEVERWEEQLWERRKQFVVGSPEKQRLTREWRANCWQRLDASVRAMDARMDAAKTTTDSKEFDFSREWQNTHTLIRRAWQAVLERFIERDSSSSSPCMPLQSLEEGLGEIASTGRSEWWLHQGLSVQRSAIDKIVGGDGKSVAETPGRYRGTVGPRIGALRSILER